jgi:proteasome assembly chaperone (PAC2) family protein
MARQSWAYVVGKYKNLVDATAYLKIRQEENERLQQQVQEHEQQQQQQEQQQNNEESFV